MKKWNISRNPENFCKIILLIRYVRARKSENSRVPRTICDDRSKMVAARGRHRAAVRRERSPRNV